MEYKIDMRLISKDTKGVICGIKKFHTKGEWYLIIDWGNFGKVQYTETMLNECFSEGKIKIDKQYYREEKLNELGL
jgi:hypothetical protein